MSKSDKMFIAFPNGGILPADISGGEEKKVSAHEPVRVPRTYGEHLVSDHFAYEAEPPKKADSAKKPDQGSPAGRAAEIATAIEGLRKAEAAAAEDAEKLRLADEIAALEQESAGMKA